MQLHREGTILLHSHHPSLHVSWLQRCNLFCNVKSISQSVCAFLSPLVFPFPRCPFNSAPTWHIDREIAYKIKTQRKEPRKLIGRFVQESSWYYKDNCWIGNLLVRYVIVDNTFFFLSIRLPIKWRERKKIIALPNIYYFFLSLEF